jgi:tRNA (Thr-GGU) A37 N-methylase
VQFSGNLVVVQGTPYAPIVQIAPPQGRRSINIQPVGSCRSPTEEHLDFRVSKILFRREQRRLELSGEVRSALQDTANQTRVMAVYGYFGLQSSWPDPRQLRLRARVYF